MLPCRSSVAGPRPFRCGNGVPDGGERVRPDATGHGVSGSLSDRDVRLDAGPGTARTLDGD
jgi:hypothetical protein